MGDTVNGIGYSGYDFYMEPDCDEQDGVCYGDSPAAAPAAAPAALHTVVDWVDDSCDGGADAPLPCASDPPDAPYGQGLLREPGDRPVGNGEGAVIDQAEKHALLAECVKETTDDHGVCVEKKREMARLTCANGVRSDGRHAEPEEEQECVDGWVHGTDARTTSHAENEEGTTGSEELREQGGSVQSGGKIGPVEIGGESNWKRSRTDIKLKTKGTTDEESRTRTGQDGSVQECNKLLVEAQRRCAIWS